jgi:phospholipid/cholesterol/gamma-HCH transport system substrate-binding protein
MKRRDEVLVGILLTVGVVIAVLGTIWLVRGGFSSGYPLYARFNWGAGVKQGQPVRLAGVQIGVVSDVELDPKGTILVTMSIVDEHHVPRNSTAAVVPVGIFGDQEIALIPKEPSPIFFNERDSVPPAPPKAGLPELTRQLTLTQTRFRNAVAAIDSVQLDSTMRNLTATSRNLAAFTDSLSGTASNLNALLAKADKGDGTIGRLLNDPGLYYDLRRLTTRLDSLTADFTKNPRRYINLEIF